MLCQRWGVGPTQILEGEDAGYVLAIMRTINGEPPNVTNDAPSVDDKRLALLANATRGASG